MNSNLYLPDGVEDLLPPAAWHFEDLRRSVLDLFVRWGFQYIDPPVVEYLDALLVAAGADLDLQTLKTLDQISGRQLGVRADLTSQAMRIDSQRYQGQGVQRFCYAGPVVFASPISTNKSRVPFKAGVEIFGADSLEADAEIINLMVEVTSLLGITSPVLLLGHMGIYRALTRALLEAGELEAIDEPKLFRSIQLKSQTDIDRLLKPSRLSSFMKKLPMLMMDDLEEAKQQLKGAPDGVAVALLELVKLVDLVDVSSTSLRFDVAELTGYGYHNGPVYSLYHPRFGSALAQGGRYDGLGDSGEAGSRPATGFDIDLKLFLTETEPRSEDLIFAPFVEGNKKVDLMIEVAELRQQGRLVVCALSKDEVPPKFCTHHLVNGKSRWTVVQNI